MILRRTPICSLVLCRFNTRDTPGSPQAVADLRRTYLHGNEPNATREQRCDSALVLYDGAESKDRGQGESDILVQCAYSRSDMVTELFTSHIAVREGQDAHRLTVP